MKKETLSAIQLANLINKDKLCPLTSGIRTLKQALIYPNYSYDSLYPEKEMEISEALDYGNYLRRKGRA